MRSWLLVVSAAASLAACDAGREAVIDPAQTAWVNRPIYRYGFIPFMHQPGEAPVLSDVPGAAGAPLQAPPIEIQQERSTRLFGPGLSQRLQLRV